MTSAEREARRWRIAGESVTPGDGSAAVPSEPRRWTLVRYVGGVTPDPWSVVDGGWDPPDKRFLEAVTVEEVGPVSETQVETQKLAAAVFRYLHGLHSNEFLARKELKEAAERAVLSAAREVKSDV